ncbi:MAG: FHA domain-containing protein [Anaerolineales bacterium]
MANGFLLSIKSGPTAGQQVALDKRSLVLGRDPACDVVIDDAEVSRRHARLIAQSGGYAIEDLGSTNGTFVDGQRIRTVMPLQPGASVRLGELVTFTYEAIPPDEVETRDFASTPPSASQRVVSRSLRAQPLAPPPAPVEPELPPLAEELEAAPVVAPTPIAATPKPRLRQRRGGLRLPIFSRKWTTGCAIIALLGACGFIAFFWYVDANFLWCDVFGGLISACVP